MGKQEIFFTKIKQFVGDNYTRTRLSKSYWFLHIM